MTTSKKSAIKKHPGMTNTEFVALGNYIRMVGDKMGLRDWLFNLMHGLPQKPDGTDDPEAGAQCQPIWGKKVANIFVGHDFRQLSPERQRVFVCHELLHCHFDQIDSLVENDLHTHLGEIYYRAWKPGYTLATEHCVNAIAEEWAKTLPPIKWPSGRRKPVRRKPMRRR